MASQISDRATTTGETDFDDVSSLMNLSRDKCATIAEDTLNKLKAGWYRSNDAHRIDLEKDIRFSVDNSVLYTENDLDNIKKSILTPDQSSSTPVATAVSSCTKFEVRHCTTLQAAQFLATEMDEDRVGVLNFASAKNPGGGFLKGSKAQEESIARSSSLYLSLTQDRIFNGFYNYHRHNKNGLYSHRIIYSPRVTVFKDDNGKLLTSPYHVGIVTVPAPNASIVRDLEAIRNAMRERIKRLLYVFEANKHDILVLGAFGCGVFKNNPLEVAITFRQHLESERFQNSFKRIIFAVLDLEMCRVFERVFTGDHLSQIQSEVPLNNDDNPHYPSNNPNTQYKKVTKQRRKENNDYRQVRDNKRNNYYDQEDDDE